VRSQSIFHSVKNPSGNRLALRDLGLERTNVRGRSVKDRYRAASVLAVAIHVCYIRSQQLVGLGSDLMRSSVVDVQQASRDRPRISTPSDFHGKRLLEDSLPQVTGKEQAVRAELALGLVLTAARESQPRTLTSCASSTTTKSKG
jgi:hypothetical protein